MRPQAAILVAVLPLGCDSPAPPSPTGPGPGETASAVAPAPTLSVGAVVVAATSPLAFSQGEVVAVQGDEVTFASGRPHPETGKRPERSVPARDAYRIGAPREVREGDYLLCGVVERPAENTPVPAWSPCRVLGVTGEKVRVQDHYGTRHELPPNRVVKPREATQKAIATYVETELAHRAFDDAFEAAGHPSRPAGWEPTREAAVVIHFVGTSWYGGTVVEPKKDKGKVRVHFEGKRWSDRDVAWTEVAPQPSTPSDVKVDQFVIVRPQEADDRWEHRRVTAVEGETVSLVDRDGEKSQAARTDVLPFVADGS